jgi:hypothetical protein
MLKEELQREGHKLKLGATWAQTTPVKAQIEASREEGQRNQQDFGGSVWESNVIRDGISSTYEERRGAKSRINDSKKLLLFPDLFPRFRKAFEISNPGKLAHTLGIHTSAEDANLAARMASRQCGQLPFWWARLSFAAAVYNPIV